VELSVFQNVETNSGVLTSFICINFSISSTSFQSSELALKLIFDVNKFLSSLIQISFIFTVKLTVFDSQFFIKTDFLESQCISALLIFKITSKFLSFHVLLNITGDKTISSFEPKNHGKLSFIINFFAVITVL